MRIDPVIEKNLKNSSIGRAKLKLVAKISGQESMLPTQKQKKDFVKRFAHNYPLVKFFVELFKLSNYYRQTFKNDLSDADLKSALVNLEKFPLKEPVFYEFVISEHNKVLCAYVNSDELRDGGHIYTIVLFEESGIPDSLVGFVEVRCSQNSTEPAYIVNPGAGRKYAADDLGILDDSVLLMSLQLLIDLADSHLNSLVSMDELSQPGFDSEQLQSIIDDPEDEEFDRLLSLVFEDKAKCYLAEIPLQQISPYSYDHCFRVPLYLIEQAETVIDSQNFSVLVYQAEDKYVTSDCYAAYLAIRKLGILKIKAVIMAETPPKNLSIINQGGKELIPPIMAMPHLSYDNLEFGVKDLLLEQYARKLSLMRRSKDLTNARCILLTEDSSLDLIEALLQASQFNTYETCILSYKNCTNIDSLSITISIIKNINRSATVLIHRDRDYLIESEIQQIANRIKEDGAVPFFTSGTDIESHFINEEHIFELYPTLSQGTIATIIKEATDQTKTLSIDLIKKKEHGDRYRNKASYLDEFIDNIYESNRPRFRCGKKTLGIVKSLLQKEIKQNVDLARPSVALSDPVLNEIANQIWVYR